MRKRAAYSKKHREEYLHSFHVTTALTSRAKSSIARAVISLWMPMMREELLYLAASCVVWVGGSGGGNEKDDDGPSEEGSLNEAIGEA